MLCAKPGDEIFVFGPSMFSLRDLTVVLCFRYGSDDERLFKNCVNSLGLDAIILNTPNAISGNEQVLKYNIDSILDGKGGVYTYNNVFGSQLQQLVTRSVIDRNPKVEYVEGIVDFCEYTVSKYEYHKLVTAAVSYYPFKFQYTPVKSSIAFTDVLSSRAELTPTGSIVSVSRKYLGKSLIVRDTPTIDGCSSFGVGSVIAFICDVPDSVDVTMRCIGYVKDFMTDSGGIGGIVGGMPRYKIRPPVTVYVRTQRP